MKSPLILLTARLLIPVIALHAANLILVAKNTAPAPIIVFKDAPRALGYVP